MKNILITYLLLFAFTSVFAQEKIYFDKNWDVTNKANASYYRIVEKKAENTFLIKDYYLDGSLQMKAFSSKKDKDVFEGEVVWYDKLGNKSSAKQYLQGEAHGKSIKYAPNGIVIAEGIYKNGEPIEGVFEEYQDFNDRPAYISDYNQQRNAYLVYKNGQIIGKNFYYKNTDKIAQKEFKIDDGKNQKEWFFYNKKGDQIGHVLFGNTYSWKKNGTMILFYIKDFEILSIKAKRKYVDDIPKGEEITYKKDGSIWFKGTYKNGEKYDGDFLDGYHFTYNKGVLSKVVYYDDTYDSIYGELTFKDEKPYNGLAIDGGDEKYYKNGELTRIKTYFNDNQNNIKNDEIFLDNGKSEKKWFSKTGKLLGLGLYEYGQILNGLEINKDYTIFTNYKNSKKQGVEKEFSIKNGNLLRKTMYENDHIVWSDIAHPLKKNKMLHLSYKNYYPWNGEQFRPYSDAFHGFDYKKYQNAILVKQMEYDAEYKDSEGNEEEEVSVEEVNTESDDEVASKHSNTGKCYKKVYQLTDNEYEPNYLCIKNTTTYDTLGKKLSYTFYRNHKSYTMTYKNGIEYTGTTVDYSNKLVTYKNGQKIKVLEYFQGGQGIQPQKKYYKNGNIKQTGNSINGSKIGVWKFYFKNGNLKETGQFQDGLKTGEWKIYRKTGSLWETGFYNKGKSTGKWKQYHENGKLNEVSIFKDDLGHRVESYDINGIPVKDRKTYKWQSYNADGTIYRKGEYLDEKKHGKWIWYNDDGQIDFIFIYENGIKKEAKSYYYDGKLKSEAKYKNDKKNWEITYFENGKIKKSLIDSVEKTFYENGQLKRSRKIIDHLAEGKWEYYYKNGQIKRIEFYDKDQAVGKWKTFYSNGKKLETIVFNKDLKIGIYKEYYENGKIKTTGDLTNTLKKTGEWKYYDEKGKLTDTETLN